MSITMPATRAAAVGPELARSWLLVNAAHPDRFAPAVASAADVVLLDYRRDTGFDDDPLTLAYTRSQFTIASKAAGLPGPIDGPAVGALGVKLADSAGVTVQFGMTGKICLMPEQAPTVNEILSPSMADRSWAVEFLTDFEAHGAQIRNGSDLPRLARARKVLSLSQAYGLTLPQGYDLHYEAPLDTYHC